MLRELGRGAMAVVWLARTTGPGGFERLCALKKIHTHLAAQPEFTDLFLNEARIAARIHHPNVIQVHGIDTFEGQYVLRMDYVDGATLFHALQCTWNQGQPFPLDVAALVFAGVADGLHAAHELTDASGTPLGVIHRDLGPHNVMLGRDGIPRVMDFGIAKALDRVSVTQPGTFRGTVAFMSPEHVRGEPLDRRADIFSLGVLLWETTVGQRLFRHTTAPGTMSRILALDVPRPRTLRADYPPELEEVVMAALERDRSQRPDTARELAEDLRRVAIALGVVPSHGPIERFMAGALPPRSTGASEVFSEAHTQPSAARPPLAEPTRTPAATEPAAEPVTAVERRPARRGPRPRTRPRSIVPWALGTCAALLVVMGLWAWRAWPPSRPAAVSPVLVTLTFDVQPADAALQIDGEPHQGPLVVPLSPHAYRIEVSAPGHQSQSLLVSAEDSRVVEVRLTPDPPRKKRRRAR